MTKSFLIWALTLTVCFLVVGFPVVVVLMTIGVLAAIVLQSVLPASAILLVATSILGGTVTLILFSSVLLTIKGVNPEEVKWLGWLREKEQINSNPIYASCPLTCSLHQV
jgi:Mn2+/Fe2+ NRAMP family transporter